MRPEFKPCPICGREMNADRNLYFLDIESEYLTEFSHVCNYDDIHDPSNITVRWDELNEKERIYAKGEYEDAVEGVDTLLLQCPCGFAFRVDAECVNFPEPHWLDALKELANRRAA